LQRKRIAAAMESQRIDKDLSKLFRNVPIVNLLEMSPFAVDIEQQKSQ
jgi:hypothetical protein